MAGNDITLWELARRLDRFEADQRERSRASDDRMAEGFKACITREGYEERWRAALDRIGDLERRADQSGIYRRNLTVAVVASLVAALGAVLASLVTVLVK